MIAASPVDYRAVAFTFCNSLIKNEVAAEKMVDAILGEMRESSLDLRTRQKFEAHLFKQLRNQCLAYLKTATKKQLLRQVCVGTPAEHPANEFVEWPKSIKEKFLTRSILRFF
ncbi:hypothetical protein GCM10027347_27470 [Larkinella harenae]